jgi:putative flippase GtrA
MLQALYTKHHNLVKYMGIGVINTIFNQGLFVLFFNILKIDKYISEIIATNLSIFLSFALNTILNYKTFDKIFARFLTFYSINIFGILLSLSILYIFSDVFKFNTNLVKILSILPIFVIMFLLNKIFTFKKSMVD